MGTEKNALSEEVLVLLGARTLRIIKEKGIQLEADIMSRLGELEKIIIEAASTDGLVTVNMDGNHRVIETRFSPTFTDWSSDELRTCALITEAMNAAIDKVDFIIDEEISVIKLNSLNAVLEKSSKAQT